MYHTEFYIPVVRDSNRKRHSPRLWKQLEHNLLKRFGGFTQLSNVRGAWLDSKNQLITDISRHYALATNNVAELRIVLGHCCELFDQQCIYFNVAGRPEFIGKHFDAKWEVV